MDGSEVLRRCRALREAPLRARLVLACCLSEFVAWDGPARLGWSSQHDYSRSHLGLPWGRFHALRRAGDRIVAVPELQALVQSGALSWSAMEALSALPSAALRERLSELPGLRAEAARELASSWRPRGETTPAEDRTRDPSFARLQLDLPTPVAQYVDDTLRLADALLGAQLPEDQAFAAVLAEASTELTEVELDDRADDSSAPRTQTTSRSRSDCERRPTPESLDPDRRCLALHRLMRRCLAHLARHRIELEDTLFEFHRAAVHVPLGFRRFHDFTAECLALPERTTFDGLRSARLRRQDDPVALALRDGHVSRVQAALLEAARRMGIPRRDLRAWIEFAARHTVRALRKALAWARRRFCTEAGRYTNEGCPPPSEAQLRTPARSLESIATQSEPPDASILAQAPRIRRSWTLERDALALYHRMAAALLPRRRGRRAGPSWWPLLRIFHDARRSWSEHYARPIAHPHRQVLERDEWSCSSPDCSSRRNLQVHHIRFRSQGGTDDAENLSTLCAFHHQRGVHGSPVRLRVEGDAIHGLHSLRFTLGPAAHADRCLSFAGERRLR